MTPSEISSTDSSTGAPPQYHEFEDVFDTKGGKTINTLPPHQPYNLTIDLQTNSNRKEILPKPTKIYPLNQEELQVLKEYIDENLKKGFIHPSKAPHPCPVLFIKKANGELCLCHDYQALNRVTK